MSIPRIIHQLWIDADVPERYVRLRNSWARLNPGWEMRLWTDADLLHLVEARYPDLLAIYLGYRRNINRADLGRYLVLHAFGGVYADLDCECLRPMDGLVSGLDFAIGLEPDSHAADHQLASMISAAFIASAPAHPFWQAVMRRIRARAGVDHVLTETGPILLNEAYEIFADKGSVTLLPAALAHPFTSEDCWSGRVYDLEFWEQATRDAYQAHYWDGTWHRTIPAPGGLPFDIPTAVNAVAAPAAGAAFPRISCLLASTGRLADTRGAIDDFVRQTYGARELIIGAAAFDPDLTAYVEALGRTNIRQVEAIVSRPFDAALLAEAGDVVCGWAADVVHDPRRLEVQQRIRQLAGAAACLCRREVVWRPAAEQVCISTRRPIADSALAERGALIGLAPITEDTAWLHGLYGAVRSATFDMPRLTLRLDTSPDPSRFETAWAAASTHFAPDRTFAVLHQLAARLSIDPERGARLGPPTASPSTPRILRLPLSGTEGPLPAEARNHALFEALRDEDWVLWSDSSSEPPPGVAAALIAQTRDVALADTPAGPVILVRADLHREGLLFPVGDAPMADISEMARAMGHDVKRLGAPF